MMPTKIVVTHLGDRTRSGLADQIQSMIQRGDFIGIDPFAPFYAEGFYQVILVLTVVDDSDGDSGPPRWR